MKLLVFLTACLFAMIPVMELRAQDVHKELRKGDRSYRDGALEKAEEHYRDAAPSADKGRYNLGNALYRQQRFEEALKIYNEVLNDPAASKELKQDALFNLGNAHYELKNYQKSVEAFRDYLRENPGNEDAVENLWKAWRKLVAQQQQQQQQSQQSKENQEEGNEEQNDSPQNSQSPQQEQSGENEQQDNRQPVPADALRDEEAEQLLDIVERQDERVREELKERSVNQKKPKKDW